MKIGVLTFHETINHGAFFQAYAVYLKLIELGNDVEVIHYKNSEMWLNEYRAFILRKQRPTMLLKNISKMYKFKADLKRLKLTRFTRDVKKIDSSYYDAIVIGSDIVWNYEWEFLGRDPIYFGHGLDPGRLISYAPSFGDISPESQVPDFVVDGLKRFSGISVRDKNSAKIVKNVLGIEPQIVLDPTLICDLVGEEKSHDICEEYLLVYAFKLRPEEIKAAICFAERNGLKTVSVSYSNEWCDKNIVNVGPFEWLGYFKKAKYILTSTYHGTIFSIKYRKTFAVSNNVAIANKVDTLLDVCGLRERIIKPDAMVEPILNREIDYMKVKSLLDPKVEASLNYLKGALDG